jgi:23S rRNA pseudouridine1911/1915/1917 synthase
VPSCFYRIRGDLPPDLRLDRYVAERLGLLSRSQIKSRSLRVRLGGRELKLSLPLRKIPPGELLEFSWSDPGPLDLLPQELPLEIVYEDERVVVVNKAPGMVVHPGAGNPQGTLVNALLARRRFQGPGGEAFRPGIVHRLDKDTSGLIIAAWDGEALAFLAEQFKARRVRKIYGAILRGTPREGRGRVETLLCRDPRNRKRFTASLERGKPALTFYRVLRSWGSHSLVLLRPKTGRTHQLRVHMRYLGHPIAGDPLYGHGEDRLLPGGLMLHAKSLGIILPGGEALRTFVSPLPPRFTALIRRLEGEGPLLRELRR